ncbi:MAG: hypothetical protein M3O34_10470 [Chloroflexota bacterium]|nr:hypothetical protein [Chloroflexota bacterium]
MSASPDLIERSGDLKRELLAFAQEPRFERAYRRALRERFGPFDLPDEAEFANFLDHFILQRRLKDGRTVVEQFVAERPDLPEEEREMLLGWRDVVEGIFEVERLEDETLVVSNLVDELTYRVRSNAGRGVLARMKPGSFLITRIVPVADEWLLSGISSVLPAADHQYAYQAAAKLATQHPALVFRNPEKLARGWELQAEERRHFVSFFGSDLVVLPGSELAERMAAYAHFRMHEERDSDGRTAAEYYREKYGIEPPVLDFGLPTDLCEADTVGVVYDEVEGLNFYANFGLVEETFAAPELADDPVHREAVLTYLKEPSISPLPFRRLATRDPERASQVFRRVLGRPRFSWERNGEALLKRHKASHFEQPPLPAVTPLNDAQTRAQLAAGDDTGTRPARRRLRRRRRTAPGRRRPR